MTYQEMCEYVNSNGDWNNNNCSNSNGIRPALMEKRDE